MASRKIEDCDGRLQNVWMNAVPIFVIQQPHIIPFLTCTYRSGDEQNKLFAQGRSEEGVIVTNAAAFESPHNFMPSQAFDIAFKTEQNKLLWDNKYFEMFALIVDSIDPSIVWGGKWKQFRDMPHFETSDWKTSIHPVAFA